MSYNLANIEKTAYNFNVLKEREEKRAEFQQKYLIRKYAFLVSEFDKIPNTEPTRWEMIWNMIRLSYKMIRVLYYILKIINLVQTFKELKEMTKDKLTTLIGAIIGTIITILTVVFGYTIPPEVAQVIIGAIVAIVFWIWKPKETK